jgi:peptide/nickel transport system permease protein
MAADRPASAALAVPDSARDPPPRSVDSDPTWRERYRVLARTLVHSKTFVVGAVILALWTFDALFWRLLAPHDPNAVNPAETLRGFSRTHLFGTDDLGRDVLSRVMAGASSVLVVSFAATSLGILGGVAVGLATGYYRGVVDNVVMRLIDAALAFPLIVLALLVLAVLGRSVLNVIIVIGIVFTPLVARTVRSAVLVERERDYVAAARLQGQSGPLIMATEILPNITGPIAVEATVRLGYAVFTVSTLSFLGFGLQPPSPDWGLAVANGRAFLQIAPWIVIFPALALATLVVAVNLVADGLKQAVDE